MIGAPSSNLGRGNSSFRVLDVDMLTEDDMGVGSMFVSWSCWVEDFLMGTGWIEVGDDGTIVVVDMDTSGTWGWIDFLIVIEVDGNMVVVVVVVDVVVVVVVVVAVVVVGKLCVLYRIHVHKIIVYKQNVRHTCMTSIWWNGSWQPY